MPTLLEKLHREIESCEACPRLTAYRRQVAAEKRKAYRDEIYWGRPIPGFGDPQARLFIVGLAPAAHGANRTGRIFTGDRSGDWLFRAMHQAGFANQPTSVTKDDGLRLKGAYISCVARCAPPDNKPLPEELALCRGYLVRELALLKEARVYLALGGIALNGVWPLLKAALDLPATLRKPAFSHGGKLELAPGRWLLLSYHPSQQNTFTGRLTEPMFDSVFRQARSLISASGSSGKASG